MQLFGSGTAEDYPAPYRFQDARELAAILLRAASETAPAFQPSFVLYVETQRAIDRANIPLWRKTYATILTVIIPCYASNVLWHWYRPTSRVKQDRFNAIIAWAALFFSMPVTATAASGVNAGGDGSSLLPGMNAYLDPSTKLRRGDLNPQEMRRALYDIFNWMVRWPAAHGVGSESLQKNMAHAAQRLADLESIYPVKTDPVLHVIEGNLKTVDEIVWLANARVQASISVDFDEDAAITALVMNVVAAVVSAVAPFAGAAIGAAITKAANAAAALAQMIVSGDVTAAQVQAMAGAGAALMLEQAGIRLGLEKEMAAIQKAL